MTPNVQQVELYQKDTVHEIYPEYWIIKVEQFDDQVQDKLDEWIYFLKNEEIKNDFSAKGLKEANERLDAMKLEEEDAQEYKRYLKRLRDIASEQFTKMVDAQDLINEINKAEAEGMEKGMEKGKAEGKQEEKINTILKLYKKGKSVEEISDLLDIPLEEVSAIIESQ